MLIDAFARFETALCKLYRTLRLFKISSSRYFSFCNFHNKALENQEKLNLIILHLQTLNPVEQPKQRIEEEKEILKCTLMQSSFDPIIKEETIEIPYSYDDSITDCKIHESEMSYPIPSEFAYNP